MARTGHDCWHCDRPINERPLRFGPIFLAWSEGDAGASRGWGGDDMWECEEHPAWDGSVSEDDPWYDGYSARDWRHWSLHGFDLGWEQLQLAEQLYLEENADYLRELELRSPHHGHLGAEYARYRDAMAGHEG